MAKNDIDRDISLDENDIDRDISLDENYIDRDISLAENDIDREGHQQDKTRIKYFFLIHKTSLLLQRHPLFD